MRIPLAVNLESRDGTVTKDSKVLNGIIEVKGENDLRVRTRPGNADIGLVKAGIAQLLYNWNGINTIQADTLNRGSISTIISAPVQTALSPTNASQPWWAQDTGSNAATPYLMIHNRSQAKSVNLAGTVAAITLPAGLGTHVVSVTSLSRVGGAATAVTATDPEFDVGSTVTLAGVVEAGWNGAQVVTGITPSTFTPARIIPITITSVNTLATATTVGGVPHGLTTATSYTIAGATTAEYNGAKTITVTSPKAFTFAVTAVNTVTSPATGTITYYSGVKSATALAPGFTVTVTCTSHGLSTGTKVTVTIGGVNSPPSDKLVVNAAITVTGANTFTAAYNSAWIYGPVTNPAYPVYVYLGSIPSNAITSLTSNGVTGTVNTTVAHGIAGSGWTVKISGADQAYYNYYEAVTVTGASQFTFTPFTVTAVGTITVTDPAVSTPAKFTFTVAGTPTTPATGTITATYTKSIVPGIAYINGYFCIMDETGVVFNSNADDPTTWGALAYFTAQNENGGGVAIAKSLNYLIAFKEWSTEFFYDNANAVGSPFSPVDNGFTQIGCASGDSVASLDGNLFWVSQTRQQGRGVYMMAGLQQQKVSTPDVERILNADDLATVYAYGLKIDGHGLYLLTLVSSNITIVYDTTSQMWTQWSSYTLTATPSITSITRVGNTATATSAAAHGMSDGDAVLISGANEGSYNGIHQIKYVSTTVFTYEVLYEPTTPATGTLIFGFLTESYFKFTKYVDYLGLNLLLHESNGHLHALDSGQLIDSTNIPINVFTRSVRLDGGNDDRKKMPSVRVIGDKVDQQMMVRFSDDDSMTFTAYRIVDLSDVRPELRRCGAFERRTVETRYISGQYPANLPLQLNALEMEIAQ